MKKTVFMLFSSSSAAIHFQSLSTPPISKLLLNKNLLVLQSQKYLVWEDFLEKKDILEIFGDLEGRYSRGEMAQAAVKGSSNLAASVPYNAVQSRQIHTEIRKTSTVWLDYLRPKTITESKLLQYLDAFRMQLCEKLQCDLSFEDTEALYAHYPVDGFYKKHADSHAPGLNVKRRDTERYLSFIIYVNDRSWRESDGGKLRMYGDEFSPWSSAVDVEPLPGFSLSLPLTLSLPLSLSFMSVHISHSFSFSPFLSFSLSPYLLLSIYKNTYT